MTDKVQKIREEVEKRYKYWREKESNSHSIESEIRMSECQHLLLMLNSMQEETVSESLNTESMIESHKQRLISQANGVKNSPFIDMCLASYKHGINETLDTLNLSNIERTVKDLKESVSEDLEKASYCFACRCHPLKTEYSTTSPNPEVIEAFKAGAEWQKENDAILHTYAIEIHLMSSLTSVPMSYLTTGQRKLQSGRT